MMLSRFWLRVGTFGLILLLVYLILSYACLFTIIIRRELQVLDAAAVVSVFNPREGGSTLEGQVRNVFGDPVPYAVIVVKDRLVQADHEGRFTLEGLAPGRFTLEIFAGDYARYAREINLEAGLNSPPIKYETGLWPQEFLADFHIFFNQSGEIFGITGFANGTDQPIFIQSAVIFSPGGEMVLDLLHDQDGFSYYSNLSTKIEIAETPQRALRWAPQMWQNGEFAPIPGYFPPGPYSLEVHYAFEKGHESGQYQVLTITDHLDPESDWNPHLP